MFIRVSSMLYGKSDLMYKQFLGSRKVKNEQLPLCLFRQLWAYLRELLLFARARHRPKGKHFAFQRAWVTQRSDTFLSKEIRNITKVEYANLKTKAPSCTLNVIFNLFKFIFKNEIMMGLVIHLCRNSCCVSPMSYINRKTTTLCSMRSRHCVHLLYGNAV